MSYQLRRILPSDGESWDNMAALVKSEGIALEKNLTYSVGTYDDAGKLVATGSYFKNTMRCLAVDKDLKEEGLLGGIVCHLMGEIISGGVSDIFLYTKYETARYFRELCFYDIANVDGQFAFMENNRDAFSRYLRKLEAKKAPGGKVAAVVMNANPFTLGHQYLAEKASEENDVLHLFVVSEEESAFPFQVRARLAREGTAHLKNVVYHQTGNYILSNATFPSYFIRDSEEVTRAQAKMDAAVFESIAQTLGITARYVGDELLSFSTSLYNQVMAERLPGYGVDLVVVPRRLDPDKTPISASRVREALKNSDIGSLKDMVPPTTLDYLSSSEGWMQLGIFREKPTE